MVWDDTNEKVYASLMYKSYHDTYYYYSSAIVTFPYNLATPHTLAVAETNLTGSNYFAPSILTVYSGDRVIGFGSEFLTGSTT